MNVLSGITLGEPACMNEQQPHPAWQTFVVAYLLSWGVFGVIGAVLDFYTPMHSMSPSLADWVQGYYVDSFSWEAHAIAFMVMDNAVIVLTIPLGMLIWRRPNRARQWLLAFCVLSLFSGILDLSGSWSRNNYGYGPSPSMAQHWVSVAGAVIENVSPPVLGAVFALRVPSLKYPLRTLIGFALCTHAAIWIPELVLSLHRVSWPGWQEVSFSVMVIATGSVGLAVLKRPRWLSRLALVWTAMRLIALAQTVWIFVPVARARGLSLLPYFACYPVRAVLLGVTAYFLAKREPADLGEYPICAACGYNLTGNVSGVCPECGKQIETFCRNA